MPTLKIVEVETFTHEFTCTFQLYFCEQVICSSRCYVCQTTCFAQCIEVVETDRQITLTSCRLSSNQINLSCTEKDGRVSKVTRRRKFLCVRILVEAVKIVLNYRSENKLVLQEVNILTIVTGLIEIQQPLRGKIVGKISLR